MGLFDKNYEKSSIDIYSSEIKKYCRPKDGKTHIIMINSTSKLTSNGWECENKYTIQIDSILENMQNDGYEIIDVKFELSQMAVTNMTLIRTLIIYK